MLCHILYICMVALLETENFPFSKMYLPAIFFIIKTDKTYFDTLNHWKIPRVKTFLKHLPVCTFIWARRLVKNVNPLLQISQTYGLSPVCFLMWPTKFPENKFSVLRNIFYKIIQELESISAELQLFEISIKIRCYHLSFDIPDHQNRNNLVGHPY